MKSECAETKIIDLHPLETLLLMLPINCFSVNSPSDFFPCFSFSRNDRQPKSYSDSVAICFLFIPEKKVGSLILEKDFSLIKFYCKES
jgi:hypothetical protein